MASIQINEEDKTHEKNESVSPSKASPSEIPKTNQNTREGRFVVKSRKQINGVNISLQQ
jgi:hypothetical protein